MDFPSKEEFEEWLRQFSFFKITEGERPRIEVCPIAFYLQEKGIGEACGARNWFNQYGSHPLPKWAQRFVDLIDREPGDTHTGARMLQLLASIEEE